MMEQKIIFSRIYDMLYRPVDIASIAVVRMLFGIIIMTESYRYIDLLRIIAVYSQQSFYFKFRYFEWVKPLPPDLMQLVFITYFISGLLIFLGLFYRVAMLTATLCISYIFFVDATNYLNHFYLVIIFSFTMLFIPANRGWSLYASINPKESSFLIPGWTVWILRIQLAIVYFYAAIAKMNVDWINGMPLHDWIGGEPQDFFGHKFDLSNPLYIYFFSYGGLFYDLLIAPLLLFRRTRAFGYGLSLFFHLTNYFLFNIGIFPWFMIATTTIFFDPSWPRPWLNFFIRSKFWPIFTDRPAPKTLTPLQIFGIVALSAHLAFQVIFPLRHFFYPGYVAWDEAGHNFSWHMKLRGKSGTASFIIKDPETGKTEVVNPDHYLIERQTDKMVTRPFLILQFAHFLRDHYTAEGEKLVEVYAETRVKLNGRKSQRLVDPTVNLAQIEPSEVPGAWVFPIRQPVWNASHKKNRFGPALKQDEIAFRAIHRFNKGGHNFAQKP